MQNNNTWLREPRSDRPMRPAGYAALLLLVSSMSGCVSYSYVDKNNVQHLVGFVHATIAPTDAAGAGAAPRVLDVYGLGLSMNSVPDAGSAFTLGYAHQRLILLPNNSCVDLNAPGPCAANAAAAPPAQVAGSGKESR